MISSFLSKLGSQNNRGESWSKGFYFLGIVFIIFGLSYLAVPLYRIYCQITGYGGTIKTFNIGEITTKTTETHSIDSQNFKSPLYREITVRFNADLNENLPWIFKPAANEVKIIVGEGAAPTLTFYSLTNLSDQPAIGVATYNVTPAKAAIYFNKIQCFCFDEQRIKGNETIELSVLFQVDASILKDEALKDIDLITLSYSFFEIKE